MTIGPDNPNVGRVDQASLAAAQAQRAAQQREDKRQRVEPPEQAEGPRIADRERRPTREPRSVDNPSASEVLEQVADYARRIPPPEDLLAVQASANTFALINLDAAKEIARSVRESIERDQIDAREALFRDATDRAEVADALSG